MEKGEKEMGEKSQKVCGYKGGTLYLNLPSTKIFLKA